MAYNIYIKPSASKDLDTLPDEQLKKILHHIELLKVEPRPIGVQKLSNKEGYRIRSGSYRILFEINEKIKTISIYRVKHRKDAYK
ncbi:MAG: type II toxin-antitoxin system RelE/ParE family toxin [Ignavibacteriaceae bacterium]|nr:type II toxin-antitoxin system RelE/ParE family toxin [Ignavibacteriaceae bacterium]